MQTKVIFYNFFFFFSIFTNGNKILLAGARQLLVGVLFGGHLHMLHQPSRER